MNELLDEKVRARTDELEAFNRSLQWMLETNAAQLEKKASEIKDVGLKINALANIAMKEANGNERCINEIVLLSSKLISIPIRSNASERLCFRSVYDLLIGY